MNSQVFDHTSVGRFLEKRFGITVEAIGPWHRAVSGDLTTCFDFKRPNDPLVPALPDTSQFSAINAAQRQLPDTGVVNAPAEPQPLYQETGTRPSRALPYELHTSARVESHGLVSLTFRNTGEQGAVFHVYDKLHLDLIPRRYTVEAGKLLADQWNTAFTDRGEYDLWVYGANGFVRNFKGNALVQDAAEFKPEVQVCYRPESPHLYVMVRNTGTKEGSVTVTANAYFPGGSWHVKVKAGGLGMRHWNLEGSGHWYDFTVKAERMERRFAGRVETGQPSVSDPAMALHLLA